MPNRSAGGPRVQPVEFQAEPTRSIRRELSCPVSRLDQKRPQRDQVVVLVPPQGERGRDQSAFESDELEGTDSGHGAAQGGMEAPIPVRLIRGNLQRPTNPDIEDVEIDAEGIPKPAESVLKNHA